MSPRCLSEPNASPRTGAAMVMRGDANLVTPASLLIMDGPGRSMHSRRNRDPALTESVLPTRKPLAVDVAAKHMGMTIAVALIEQMLMPSRHCAP
jgi:hypothetical protein